MSVIIETSIGDITVDLYTDERPSCSMNFLKLCKIKYYNFSLFHTVQQNLVAQTGDPTASGRGGESVYARLYGEQARFFDMEVAPRIKHTKKGLVSMVNNGSGMHGSQFFFTLADNLDYLDGKHTVFGEVAEGFDILEKLNNTFCGEDNRPHQDIRIYHTVILDDPYDDPDGLQIPAMSPGPTEEMLNSDHIPCDADIDEDKGKTEQELMEMMAEKEAKANTQILEMVGDLPDADVAPPENVLFVCKLNPVTTSEDLEIIFSRFGTVVSCEVIKDSKTGESLQYAFIEFENEQSCENAYFKMDNVLIDDRRIHVDFSQSVSKLKWKGKGKGVEIMSSGDAPVYVLKNQQRQNDGYDLVYEHDGEQPGKERKTGKKKTSRRHSDSDDERRSKGQDNQQRKRARSRSRSPLGRNDRRRDNGSREIRRSPEGVRGRKDRDDRSRREDEYRSRRQDEMRSRREDDSRSRRDDDSRSRRDDDSRSRRDVEPRSRRDDEYRSRKDDESRSRRDDEFRSRREEESRSRREDESRSRREDESRSRRGYEEDSKQRDYERSKDRNGDERGSDKRKRAESSEDEWRGKNKKQSRNDFKEEKSRKRVVESASDSESSENDSHKRKEKKKKKKKHKERKQQNSDNTDESEDERMREKAMKKHKHKSKKNEDSDSDKAAKKSKKKKHKSRQHSRSSDSDDDRR